MSVGYVVAWRGDDKKPWTMNSNIYPTRELVNAELVLEKFKRPALLYSVLELHEAQVA